MHMSTASLPNECSRRNPGDHFRAAQDDSRSGPARPNKVRQLPVRFGASRDPGVSGANETGDIP